jgi:hypothetical protein
MLRRKFFGVMLSLVAAPLVVGCTHKLKDDSKRGEGTGGKKGKSGNKK